MATEGSSRLGEIGLLRLPRLKWRMLGILVLAGGLLLLLRLLLRLERRLLLLLMLRYRGLVRLRRDLGPGKKEGSRRRSGSRAGALVVG